MTLLLEKFTLWAKLGILLGLCTFSLEIQFEVSEALRLIRHWEGRGGGEGRGGEGL